MLVVPRDPYHGAPFVEIAGDPGKDQTKLKEITKILCALVAELSFTGMNRDKLVVELGRKIEPWGETREPTLCIFYELPGATLIQGLPSKGGRVYNFRAPNGLVKDFTLDFARSDWMKQGIEYPKPSRRDWTSPSAPWRVPVTV